MKSIILILATIASLQTQAVSNNPRIQVGVLAGPFLVTLYVPVKMKSTNCDYLSAEKINCDYQTVKIYYGYNRSYLGEAQYAAEIACVEDGNTSQACRAGLAKAEDMKSLEYLYRANP